MDVECDHRKHCQVLLASPSSMFTRPAMPAMVASGKVRQAARDRLLFPSHNQTRPDLDGKLIPYYVRRALT